MSTYDPMDFERNSVGVLVVRVIRLKDIVRALGCTEDYAQEVVREIRGETNADKSLAFVLPSQLARWTYQRAGQAVPPPPSTSMLVLDSKRGDALALAAARSESQRATPSSSSASLKEIHSDLRRLKSATVQPGALAITVEQAAARLGCAKTKVFELLKVGALKRGRRVGKRAMVLVASIDALTSAAPTRRTGPKEPHSGRPETRAEILRNLKQRP